MKPVVAHPAVDHGALGRGDFERGVRAEQGHGHRPAIVGGTDHADAAVGFGDVLDQPVDGVVGVGGVVGLGGIQGADGRPGHHIVALGAIFAADVLGDEDVAVVDPFPLRCPHGVAQMGLVRCDEGSAS